MNLIEKYNFENEKNKYNNCLICNSKKDYYSLLEPNCKICYLHKYFDNFIYIIGKNCQNYLKKFLKYINPLYKEVLKKYVEKNELIKDLYTKTIDLIAKATNIFYENTLKEFLKILYENNEKIDIDYKNIKENYLYLKNKLNQNLLISNQNYQKEYNKIIEKINLDIEKINIDLHNKILYQTNEFETNLEKEYITKMFFIFNNEFSNKIV